MISTLKKLLSFGTSGQDGGIGNMLLLLTQLQKKLHLDYKTNNIKYPQKIESYGSPTTKDLRNPHSSRHIRGPETQREERCTEAQRHRATGVVQRGGRMGSPTFMCVG